MVYFSKTMLLKHFRSFFFPYNCNQSIFSHFPLLILFEYILAKIKPLALVPRFCCCSLSRTALRHRHRWLRFIMNRLLAMSQLLFAEWVSVMWLFEDMVKCLMLYCSSSVLGIVPVLIFLELIYLLGSLGDEVLISSVFPTYLPVGIWAQWL